MKYLEGTYNIYILEEKLSLNETLKFCGFNYVGRIKCKLIEFQTNYISKSKIEEAKELNFKRIYYMYYLSGIFQLSFFNAIQFEDFRRAVRIYYDKNDINYIRSLRNLVSNLNSTIMSDYYPSWRYRILAIEPKSVYSYRYLLLREMELRYFDVEEKGSNIIVRVDFGTTNQTNFDEKSFSLSYGNVFDEKSFNLSYGNIEYGEIKNLNNTEILKEEKIVNYFALKLQK